MGSWRALVLFGIAALAGASACDASTGPTEAPSGAVRSAGLDGSGEPAAQPTPPVVGQLTGPWRRSPIVLDDRHVAIISDACAAAARTSLGEDAANLPTAVIDAQGEDYAVAILADDLEAVECRIQLDGSGGVLSIESVARLSAVATRPVQGVDLSLASVIHTPNGSRTIAMGRVGPDVVKVRAAFDDQTFVLAARADGWWLMWWKGTVKAATFAGVDNRNIALSSLPSPAGEVEARLKTGLWWLDPAVPRPAPAATRIRVLVSERDCVSGRSLEGLVDPPSIALDERDVTVTYWLRRPTGTAATCPGNPPLPMTLELPEAVGRRSLLDGGSDPPRDATTRP